MAQIPNEDNPEEQRSDEDKTLKNSILVVTAFTAFLISFVFSAFNVALPAIGSEFTADAVALGWVISSFTLTTGISLLIFGRIGDIVGRRKIFTLGMVFFTLSTFLMIFSWNISILIFLRAVKGIANAMISGTIMAIVSAVFQPGERGKALGLNLTSTYLGISLGPFGGGLLVQYFGWRSILVVLVPFQIISLILIKLKFKTEWADSAGEKFDWKGSLAFGFAMFAFMYGFSLLPSVTGWIFLGGGFLFGVLFVIIELRVNNPIFDFQLILNNRMFAFSSLASIFVYIAMGAIGFFSSLYLQYLKNLDAAAAGLIMISQPLTTALLSTLSGKLSDRINPGIIASIGLGIVSIGLFMFFLIGEASSIAYLVSLLVIIGFGFGMFSSPNTNAIMSSVENKFLGTASATLGTVRTIGQMMSMGIAMILFSLYIGREVISPTVYPALLAAIQRGFLIFSIIAALGIFVSLARSKRVTRKPAN